MKVCLFDLPRPVIDVNGQFQLFQLVLARLIDALDFIGVDPRRDRTGESLAFFMQRMSLLSDVTELWTEIYFHHRREIQTRIQREVSDANLGSTSHGTVAGHESRLWYLREKRDW